MANNYYDYLLDCALMIGANERSGLSIPQNNHSLQTSYQSLQYQQQILAAISSTVALFPFSIVNPDYPPEEFKNSKEKFGLKSPKHVFTKQISKNELQTIHDIVNQYNKSEVSEEVIISSINRKSSKMRSRRRSIKKVFLDDINGSWGSVSIETIKSFPATYFNNNLSMSVKYKNPKIQFIPLTDNMGNRSFAIIIEFYRCFVFTVNTSNSSEQSMSLILNIPINKDKNSLNIVYVPTNIIFFSKYPYFNLYREILSQFYKGIENKSTLEIEQQLMEFCSILTRIPILLSESLKLKFFINDCTFYIKCINSFSTDIIEWDMTLLFQILSIEDIISILMAMFQEQKMVFLSNNTNIITIVTETILLLFRPFLWKHFYLPTTPVHLYELVDAIFPFILGLPHSFKPKIIEYYQDIIVVDLEEGNVSIPTSCKLKYVSQELIDQLKHGLQQHEWIHSIKLISSLNPLTFEEFKASSDNLNQTFVQKVTFQFMIFMVDLFQDVIRHIALDKTGSELFVANLDKYLNTSSSQNIPFFKEIYRTDNFNCFIDDKLRKMAVDGWVRLCNLRYPELLKSSKGKVSFKLNSIRKDSECKDIDVDYVNIFQNEEKEQEIVLPTSKNLRGDYYQNVFKNIESLNKTLDVKKLKAELYLTLGDTIQSLQMFHEILLQDSSIVNHSKIRKRIRNLGKKDVEKLKSLTFHHSLFHIISYNERRLTVDIERHNIEQFNPPTVPISKKNFIDECRKADIAGYEVSMITLFNCLTIDVKSTKTRIKMVAPDIFKCFYKNWINSSIDLHDVDISSEFIDEILIKGTETCVRVDGYGLGRIILTQCRLLFIPFGKGFCNTIIHFIDNNLLKVKIDRKIRGFSKITEILDVSIKERDSKILIWFTQDTEKWYRLICEMNLLNQLSQKEKDKSLIEISTEQCLMYENMINCSKNNLFFRNNLNEMTKKLLPYSQTKLKTNKPKTDEHVKYLLAKLMPSPKQTITIDCAIEIYKPILKNFDIWCACMSQDKYFINILQIIDKKLYKLLDLKIDLPMRVLTMTEIPKINKIIICSMSHIVLLLDKNNNCIEKDVPLNFNKGSYPVYCLSDYDGSSCVYFGSNNAEILRWNLQENEAQQIIKLSEDDHIVFISLYDSMTLIVGCLYRFYIISIDGKILNIITVSELINIMSKIGYFIFFKNKKTLIVGLSRLSVVIEYDISNISNVICRRKINLFTTKKFNMSDISESNELSSSYVGIASILLTEDHQSFNNFWIMFKDGTIEIRDYKTLNRFTKFNAHVDVISKAMLCNIKDKQIIVSIGRTDGKVILWNLEPL